MSDGWVHDLVALVQQLVLEQVQDMELNLYGRVIEYDPKSHMCRVLIDTRNIETGWCQVGTGHVGNGSGDQYHLVGGAAPDNQSGEWVQVSLQHRGTGLCAVANLVYTDQMLPPGAGNSDSTGTTALTDPLGTAQLKPQERIIKHASGSFIKFYANGDVQLHATGNLVMTSTNDTIITSDT